jgi:hypothetical protein
VHLFATSTGTNKDDYIEKHVLPQTPGSPLTLLFLPPTHAHSLSGSDNDEKENMDPSISIPAPSAPRKQQAWKKRAAAAMSAARSNGNGMISLSSLLPNLTLPVDDPFSDDGVSTVTPDVSGSESGDDEHLSDASGLEGVSETPRALKRTLIKEVRVESLH